MKVVGEWAFMIAWRLAYIFTLLYIFAMFAKQTP